MKEYKNIDKRFENIITSMEQTGIPLLEESFFNYVTGLQRDLASKKQELCREVGFMVNLESDQDCERAIQVIERRGRDKGVKTVEGVHLIKERLTEAKKCREVALKAQRIYNTALNNKNTGKGFSLRPSFYIDDMGLVMARGDFSLEDLSKDQLEMVRKVDCIFIKASYRNLDLSVIQSLSGDKNLAKDLRGDPYVNLSKRLFGDKNTSPLTREVSRLIWRNCASGEGPRELANNITAFYKKHYKGVPFCLEMAEVFQMQWKKFYPDVSELIEGLVLAGSENIRSYFGRKKEFNGERSYKVGDRATESDKWAIRYPLQSTAVDLAKYGLVQLYEDYNFWRLLSPGNVIAVTTQSIIVMVGRETDGPQIMEIMQTVLREAHNKFNLDVKIEVGISPGNLKVQ